MKLYLALSLLLAAEEAKAFSVGRPAFGVVKGASSTTTSLAGILDEIESDAFDLMNTSGDAEKQVNMSDAYEMFLADLVFSTNDPRIDIMNKFDLAGDPEFVSWLQKKVETSKDPEERIALRDLHEMIVDIKTRMEVNRLAEERAAQQAQETEKARMAEAEIIAEEGRAMSNADVLKKANQIDSAEMDKHVDKAEKKKSFYEEEITPEIRVSYEGIMKKVMPPYAPGDTATSIVFKYYDQFDAQLVKLLAEKVSHGDEDAKALTEALAVEQQKRIGTAAETLKAVLATGDPMRMEGAIVKFAREGKVDEPFLLLLEANENQARAAGATGPAQLMSKLRKRANEEKDKQSSSKEVRLIRQLLRANDSAEREKILEDAFTPKAALIVPGTAENAMKAESGEAPDQEKPMPEVPPPDFINACKAVLLNFGNLGTDGDDRGDLASRIKKIAAEAEVVATRIYGKGMTLREQQDRAWEEATTSIFDLERMEIEAERMGEHAPWTNPDADDDMFMPGFDKDGRMQIGGS
eukprot:scaffold3608_cov183-Amphora_coffeaeformis.AAC.9